MEIPVPVLNHLVFKAYDEWEQQFPPRRKTCIRSCWIRSPKSRRFWARRSNRGNISTAADILNLQESDVDRLTLANAWIVSRRYVEYFEELSAAHWWKDQPRGARETEAVFMTRRAFDANIVNCQPPAAGVPVTPREERQSVAPTRYHRQYHGILDAQRRRFWKKKLIWDFWTNRRMLAMIFVSFVWIFVIN